MLEMTTDNVSVFLYVSEQLMGHFMKEIVFLCYSHCVSKLSVALQGEEH